VGRKRLKNAAKIDKAINAKSGWQPPTAEAATLRTKINSHPPIRTKTISTQPRRV